MGGHGAEPPRQPGSSTATLRAPLAPAQPMEIDHDQTSQEACPRTPRLTGRLRTGSLQRFWILHCPWAVQTLVLLHAPGRRWTAVDEMRQANLDLGGGGAALAQSP